MNNTAFLSGLLLAAAALCAPSIASAAKEPVDYADPMIGTSNSRWMLGPYAWKVFSLIVRSWLQDQANSISPDVLPV